MQQPKPQPQQPDPQTGKEPGVMQRNKQNADENLGFQVPPADLGEEAFTATAVEGGQEATTGGYANLLEDSATGPAAWRGENLAETAADEQRDIEPTVGEGARDDGQT